MKIDSANQHSVAASLLKWWSEETSRSGHWRTFLRLLSLLYEFVRDSAPSRRRQRYGDVDFDWDYRVDTTGATVGWRDRLLGLLHSPYQPTDPALFREMMSQLNADFHEYTFIDIGSGKGRVLLMAADYPFRRIVGVELFPELDRIAKENVAKYKSESQKCFVIEAVCGDAREFSFPAEPLVVYLFNPLPAAGLTELLGNLEKSLRNKPRPVIVLYHNPLLEQVLAQREFLKKIGGTHQYSVYVARSARLDALKNTC
jgi:SAM-dependent methyltransferase